MHQDAVIVADERLGLLTKYASTLGLEIIDISGFLEDVDQKSTRQLKLLDDAQNISQHVVNANGNVHEALGKLESINAQTLSRLNTSFDMVTQSSQTSKEVAVWVRELSEKMQQVFDALTAVQKNNDNIAEIASQVNILAINAKIEAARAGESGRGFGVVAEAINELSQKTAGAAKDIEENIGGLSRWVSTLKNDANTVSIKADNVIENAHKTDEALGEIRDGVSKTNDACTTMTQALAAPNSLCYWTDALRFNANQKSL